jgi:hypothetical protein
MPRTRPAILDQPATVIDGAGSHLRNNNGHHCLGHGDLRPVDIKSSPSAGEPSQPRPQSIQLQFLAKVLPQRSLALPIRPEIEISC